MVVRRNKVNNKLPFLVSMVIHFSIVTIAAYAVHYSNGINVMGYKGEYGLWMDVGWLAIWVFKVTQYLFPSGLLIWIAILKKDQKRHDWLWWGFVSSAIILASWPIYGMLIKFWERNWIQPI